MSNAADRWSELPDNILRHIVLDFISDDKTLFNAANVCRGWRTAIDHPYVWKLLCEKEGWVVTSKEDFRTKFRTVRAFRDSGSHEVYRIQQRGGVSSLIHVPEAMTFYDWRTGEWKRMNQDVVISVCSGPRYHLNVIDLKLQCVLRRLCIQKLPSKTPAKWSAIDLRGEKILFADPVSAVLYQADLSSSSTAAAAAAGLGLSKKKSEEGTLAARPLSSSYPHTSTVTSVVLGRPETGMAISTSYDETARVWDLRTGQAIAIIPHPNRLWAAGISPDGRQVVTGCGGGVLRVWKLEREALHREQSYEEQKQEEDTPFFREGLPPELQRSARLQAEFPTSESNDTLMAVEFDCLHPEKWVWTAGYDTVLRLWDYREGILMRSFHGHEDIITSIQVDPYLVVTTSRDRTVRIWDRDTGALILNQRTAGNMDVRCCALIPRGEHRPPALCFGDYSGLVTVVSPPGPEGDAVQLEETGCPVM